MKLTRFEKPLMWCLSQPHELSKSHWKYLLQGHTYVRTACTNTTLQAAQSSVFKIHEHSILTKRRLSIGTLKAPQARMCMK
jgi:hypothetical protein